MEYTINHPVNTHASAITVARSDRRSAFTIVELLVVILIGLIILTIAVPAFQSMNYSSNRSLAVNALQASSLMARDVALSTGRDGAVVFVYDPAIGRMQIIPAVKVGTLREKTTAPGIGGGASGLTDAPFYDRDVFVPATEGETIQMPRFWNVRGYANPRLLIDQDSAGNSASTWYTSNAYGGTDSNDPIKDQDHWLFPETGFFPVDAQINGGSLDGSLGVVNNADPTARQSFMIRFDARTGVVSKDSSTALFVNPRNSRERPYGDQPTNELERSLRVDISDDLGVWASRMLMSGNLTPGDLTPWQNADEALRVQMIGNGSNDTVLVKAVTRLAIYDERRLAIGVGARGLNQVTQTLYMPADQTDRNAEIEFDMDLFSDAGLGEEDVLERINQWIDGNTTFTFDGDYELNVDDEPESRLYLIQSYTGELQEVLR